MRSSPAMKSGQNGESGAQECLSAEKEGVKITSQEVCRSCGNLTNRADNKTRMQKRLTIAAEGSVPPMAVSLVVWLGAMAASLLLERGKKKNEEVGWCGGRRREEEEVRWRRRRLFMGEGSWSVHVCNLQASLLLALASAIFLLFYSSLLLWVL
jgi:hypothetical protein